MFSRSIAIAVIAAASILFGLREVSAHDAGPHHNFMSPNASGLPLNLGKGRGSQTRPWAFYSDLTYYADPGYFLRCYQRTRIETLYWVTWRPVSVCK